MRKLVLNNHILQYGINSPKMASLIDVFAKIYRGERQQPSQQKESRSRGFLPLK